MAGDQDKENRQGSLPAGRPGNPTGTIWEMSPHQLVARLRQTQAVRLEKARRPQS